MSGNPVERIVSAVPVEKMDACQQNSLAGKARQQIPGWKSGDGQS